MEATTTITVEEYNRLTNEIKNLEKENDELNQQAFIVREVKKEITDQVTPAAIEMTNKFLSSFFKEIGFNEGFSGEVAKFSDPEYRWSSWYGSKLTLSDIKCEPTIQVSKASKSIGVYFSKIINEE